MAHADLRVMSTRVISVLAAHLALSGAAASVADAASRSRQETPRAQTKKAPSPSKAAARKAAQDRRWWDSLVAGGVMSRETRLGNLLRQKDPTLPREILWRAWQVKSAVTPSGYFRQDGEFF